MVIYKILWVSHIFACIWIFVGRKLENAGEINWLRVRKINEDIWYN